MQCATKLTALPALAANPLLESGLLIDNLFASLWQRIGIKTILNLADFNKRSGTPTHEAIYFYSKLFRLSLKD